MPDRCLKLILFFSEVQIEECIIFVGILTFYMQTRKIKRALLRPCSAWFP